MLSIGFRFKFKRSIIVLNLFCFPSSVFAPKRYEAVYAPRAERGIFMKLPSSHRSKSPSWKPAINLGGFGGTMVSVAPLTLNISI